MDAIVINNVTKRFRKNTIRREYTTFKSELVNWIRGRRQPRSQQFIEALRGVDLTIPRGKTVGVLGRNGSGKSTLLKVITGIYGPTTGSITVNGRISALLDLGAGFHPDFSGRENILINGIILGMSRSEVRDRMDAIIAFSELGEFIDEPVRTYSSGMYMRLAFAVATHVDPDILIVDEILAVGDEHFGRKSLARMTEFKNSGRTIVLVTHDLGTVERWCDLAAWIDGGKIREFGPPAEVCRHYRQAVQLAENRDTVFVPPAIAVDGGALPQLGPSLTPPPSATVAPIIERLRVLGATGEEVPTVGPEDEIEVRIDFSSPSGAEDPVISVAIVRTDGLRVYETSTLTDGVELPRPLPAMGAVRFQIKRLGLLPGDYAVEVASRGSAGVGNHSTARAPLIVRSPVGDSGITRPAHTWELVTREPEDAGVQTSETREGRPELMARAK